MYMSELVIGWLALIAGFTLGWMIRWWLLSDRLSGRSLDRELLLSISHLLEDAEAGLSSIEGIGEHRGVVRFTAVKSKVCLAQALARNLLGVEQRFGRGGTG